MDRFASLWNLAPLWAALVALIIVASVIARRLRLRAAQAAARSPAPTPPAESDADAVDSSHIGFAPLVSDAPHRALLDTDAPTRGEDSGTARQ